MFPFHSDMSSLHSLLSHWANILDELRDWAGLPTYHSRGLSSLIIHTLSSSYLFSHHPGLSIVACAYKLNLERQLLLIEWGVSGCGEHKLAYDRSVDVYLNDASNKVLSYDPQKPPDDLSPGFEYIQELIGFETEHRLHPSAHLSDSHTFHLFAFAIDPATNVPVEITKLDVPNSLSGFTLSSSSTKATKEFRYHTATAHETMDVVSSVLTIEIEPSNFSRSFNICILVTSWVLTLGSVYITVVAIRNRRVDFKIVLLHASISLVTSSLRKLSVSLPTIGGCADVVGFSLQIAIMALSSLSLVYNASKSYLRSRGCPHSFEKT